VIAQAVESALKLDYPNCEVIVINDGKVKLSGWVSSRIEYTAQIGAGIQREAVYARQWPLVTTGTLFAMLNRHLMLQVDAGRSTSSLERINPGRESYARFVVAFRETGRISEI
jgi:cellulose synthase/poly-beta-1,6-N-acetylglucosamine synthase-like glycosyltransferase